MKHTKIRMARAATVIVAAFAIGSLGTAAPATAAEPPTGYPTQQIVTTANNPTVGSIPIRRGFWNADYPGGDRGWGMDKAWNKHNIWSLEAMRRVMLSTNVTPQGAQHLLKAYAGKYTCSGSVCKLTDQREIYGIYNSMTYSTYYDWPVGGKLGLQTMYCNQGGAWSCPNWVTYSITNPGVNNPYSLTNPSSKALTRVEPSLSAEQQRVQATALASEEIVRLTEAIAAGDEQVSFSYNSLPKEIPAH
ncbi:hypothetical protein [Arthrobacter sp. B2a2-09]|uniref:hypothetical protein n=1 Tax=Arthrobacter sp. B2a2-09 TaxID=2952822 RepID=UPI0022CDA663|nr:hypothetical protein [Arthrobacter sp. B2a2-09]MCZ9884950.1 hypothetical protein [Arthrobacter sp. B2a2-09]